MRVAFVVNGSSESAMGHRARAFASRLGDSLDVQIAYRSHSKVHATARFFLFLLRARPQVTYVMDMAYSGVIAAVCYRALKRNRLMVDTGDAIRELARSMGRGPVGLWLTGALERLSLGAADLVAAFDLPTNLTIIVAEFVLFMVIGTAGFVRAERNR